MDNCEDLSNNAIYNKIHAMFKANIDYASCYFMSYDAYYAFDADNYTHRFIMRTVFDVLGLKHEFVLKFLDYFEFDNSELHKFGITYVSHNNGHYRILTGYGC